MTDYRLCINDVLMDMSASTEITLDLKSNIFRSLADITSNSTYSIKLPKTVKNMAALENCDNLSRRSNMPYQRHRCKLYRNGVAIIANGRFVITSMEADICGTIIWGVSDALLKLADENKNLNELTSDAYLTWGWKNTRDTYEAAKQRGYFYADYDPFIAKDNGNDWKYASGVVAERTTNSVELTDVGCYETGTKTGQKITPVIDKTATDYRSANIGVSLGDVLVISDIVADDSHRAYAVLDSSNNILQLAPAPTSTQSGYNTEESLVPIGGQYFPAGVMVWNIHPRVKNRAMRVTRIAVFCVEPATLTVGIVNDSGSYLEQTEIEATQGLGYYDVEFVKPVGSSVYISANSNVLCRSTTQPYECYSMSGDTIQKITGASLCYNVKYSGEMYVPQDFRVSLPAQAARVLVNADIANSGEGLSVAVETNGQAFNGGTNRGETDCVQPSVSVDWVRKLIASEYGITLNFGDAGEAFIDSLAIPLISHDNDGSTGTGVVSGTFADTNRFGRLTMDIGTSERIISNPAGTSATEFSIAIDATVYFDIRGRYSFDITTFSAQGHGKLEDMYWLAPCYMRITVKHPKSADKKDDVYITCDDPGSRVYFSGYNIIDDRVNYEMYGYGNIDVVEGDVVYIEFRNDRFNPTDLKFHDGTFAMSVDYGDNVPRGGKFPIASNLPEITTMDFIKSLGTLCGVFPLKNVSSKVVTFAPLGVLWDNVGRAVDWSSRLVAAGAENTPRKAVYKVDGWAKKNWYKWKEDDKTQSIHNGCIVIDNDALDEERNAIELPFASGIGNNVPVYTPEEGKRGSFGDNKTNDEYKAPSYSGCQPRIMQLVKTSSGTAALNFTEDLDLQRILDTKYIGVVKALTKAVVITEQLVLTDIDIATWDETVPVYLAQYGAYFAVLEIKTTSAGYSEATMIQITL